MKRSLYALTLSVCAALGTLSAAADAKPEKEKERHQGPLAGLPSLPGPHVAKIQALGDNQWLNLGPPAADPARNSVVRPQEYRHEIETALVHRRSRCLAPAVRAWLPQLHRGGRARASSATGDPLQPPAAESHRLP